jgi:hypothetical protein
MNWLPGSATGMTRHNNQVTDHRRSGAEKMATGDAVAFFFGQGCNRKDNRAIRLRGCLRPVRHHFPGQTTVLAGDAKKRAGRGEGWGGSRSLRSGNPA